MPCAANPCALMTPLPIDFDSAMSSGRTSSGVSLSSGLLTALQDAIRIITTAFDNYGCSRVAVAFNGGKDATVVLHLARAVAWRTDPTVPLQCMYLKETDPFPEVTAFVRDTAQAYNITTVEQAGGFKMGTKAFVEERGVVGFVMGTRRGDPFAETMEAFMPSSPGWAEFVRVNPILDWEYSHVWEFLRSFKLPYCALYDKGYTSIGNTHDTLPNPELTIHSDQDRHSDKDPVRCMYLPAWELMNPNAERAGRVKYEEQKCKQTEKQ